MGRTNVSSLTTEVTSDRAPTCSSAAVRGMKFLPLESDGASTWEKLNLDTTAATVAAVGSATECAREGESATNTCQDVDQLFSPFFSHSANLFDLGNAGCLLGDLTHAMSRHQNRHVAANLRFFFFFVCVL